MLPCLFAMTTFRWKGRGPEGQQIQGELEARSKDEVITRLRAQRIMVSQILELGGGEPPDPDRVAVRDPEPRRPDSRPRPLRGLLTGAALLGGAAGLGALALQGPSEGQWVPFLLAGILALLGVLMIGLSILAMFAGPSKWIRDKARL